MDLAEQFDFDQEIIVGLFTPIAGTGLHRIGERHDTVFSDADRNQPSDGPEFCEIGGSFFRHGGNGCAGAIAGDDAPEHAVTRMHAVAAILFASAAGCLEIVVTQ